MSKKEFHNQLREWLHREPFRPFVVRLRDGRDIVIKKPPVVFADGAASFIDFENEALVDFYHNEVKSFELLEKETAV